MPPADGNPALSPASGPAQSAKGPGVSGGAGAAASNAGVRASANAAGGGANTAGLRDALLASTSLPPPSASRPRNQGGRKKALAIEPDSLYRGTSVSTSGAGHGVSPHGASSLTASSKRAADGVNTGAHEPRKRKRIEAHSGVSYSKQTAQNIHGYGHGHVGGGVSARGGIGSGTIGTGVGSAIPGTGTTSNYQNSGNSNNIGITGGSNSFGHANAGGVPALDADGHSSLVEFSKLPTLALYEYIIQFELVPVIYPAPVTADDPPPPAALLDPARMASRAPTPTPLVTPLMPLLTPANRPRRSREAKDGSRRRRSTRLLEEELRGAGVGGGLDQVPVLADVSAIHGVLATIAARHFRESSVREMDTLASFLGAVKARR